MRFRLVRMAAVGLALMAMLAGYATPARAQDTQNFTIRSFHADYYLSRDSQRISKLRVEEKIVAEFPSFDQNHGILRAIPQTYQGHDVSLKIEKVVDPGGNKLKYTTDSSNGNLVLKIGDPNRYVHGLQEYDITYTMQNVTAKFEDHDEFFWDVNGDGWKQPFGLVTARVHIPKELAAHLQAERRCYTGANDSQQADCTVTADVQADKTVIQAATSRNLNAGETMSFVLGFQPDTFVAYQIPLSQILWWAAGVVIFGLIPPAFALYIVIRKWRQYGRDAVGTKAIVPQYLPPKELSVLGSSEVIRQRFVASSISAQILDLAVRHYVKIYETVQKKVLKDKSTYSVELSKTPTGLKPEEKAVIAMLFGAAEPQVGARVDLGDLSNKLYKKAADLGGTIDTQLAHEGYFVRAPQKVFQTYLTWGIVLCVLGFIFPPFTLGLLLAGLVVLCSSRLMPARTQKGVDARDYLYGLRDYIKLAEADRLKVLQSPRGELTEKIDVTDTKKMVKLYERLLPYAMLFGLEREWARQFADMYRQPPDWYSGTSTFNAVYFAGALHSFSTTSNATFSPPSSSGSSGFSGGGAGGGGGGGGGGGW